MQKTVLVTGGNRGIGLAIAKGLVGPNMRVIIGSRNAEDGAEAAAFIGATSVQLDVTNSASINSALSAIGNVDILINNAGVKASVPLLKGVAGLQESLSVMLWGSYHLILATVPAMINNGYGRIVNVSSGWGSFAEGMQGPNGYGVAKAALNALTVSLAQELPPTIKVNTMCPGWVRTRMGGDTAPLTPEQGADTAIWLATIPDDGPSGKFFRNRKQIQW